MMKAIIAAGWFTLCLGTLGTSPVEAQTIDTTSYSFRGRTVPVAVLLNAVGIYAPFLSQDSVQSIASGVGAATVENITQGLFVLGFAAGHTRAQLYAIARDIVLDTDSAVRAAGLAARVGAAPDSAIIPDYFVAEFLEGVTPAQIDSLNALHDVVTLAIVGTSSSHHILSPTSEASLDALALANVYSQSPLVTLAVPDFFSPKRDRGPTLDDELVWAQWHLHAENDNDINAPEAWAFTKGSSGIVIGVLETYGFDISNPDLAPNLDQAWNFFGCLPTDVLPCGSATFGDERRHGTAVAGLAAGRGDNTEGISGVCPECKLMLFELPTSDQATALVIEHAVSQGADVINHSWSWGYDAHPITVDAVENITNVAPGHPGTFIAWTVWDIDEDRCVGSLRDVSSILTATAVAASNNLDERASRTGRGDCIDILAPGYWVDQNGVEMLGIATTDETGSKECPDVVKFKGYNDCDPLTGIPCAFAEPATETNARAYTRCFSGGSAATPIVAGVAGLMLSLRPCLTRVQIQEILYETAEKIGPDPNYVSTPEYGHGRVDAGAALQATSAVTCVEGSRTGGGQSVDDPSSEIGTRLGMTALSGPSSDGTVSNLPGSGPLSLGIIYIDWFPTNAVMLELQLGGANITGGGTGDEREIVMAFQPGLLLNGADESSVYLGPNVAWHLRETTMGTDTDWAPGLAVGYRFLPETFLALRFEARYRHWIDQSIDEIGFAFQFGVVLN